MSVPLNGKRKARQLLRSERRKNNGTISSKKADVVIRGIQNGIVKEAKKNGHALGALELRSKTVEVLEKWRKVGKK